MSKIILDLCGGTGSWSKPYKEAGYDVRLITLPQYDLKDEKTVQYCIGLKAHGILCATPCEMWGLMGNCRWRERTADDIYQHTIVLIHNLRIIYESAPKFWCIENPPGKMRRLLGEPQFVFDPYNYGESYHKKTYLWGNFNLPINPLIEGHDYVHDFIRQGLRNGRDKSEVRAITPAGFAKAFYEANK